MRLERETRFELATLCLGSTLVGRFDLAVEWQGDDRTSAWLGAELPFHARGAPSLEISVPYIPR